MKYIRDTNADKVGLLLPVLICIVCPPGATYIPSDKLELSAGDTVRVELDPDLFKIAQEQHGGWNDAMAEVRLTWYGVH